MASRTVIVGRTCDAGERHTAPTGTTRSVVVQKTLTAAVVGTVAALRGHAPELSVGRRQQYVVIPASSSCALATW